MGFDLVSLLAAKPVLIGLHLGFAIVGIDAFLWLLGELAANSDYRRRTIAAAVIGVLGFVLSWIFGGYYYVVYYGALVKPVIKQGLAPWAHNIVMETKEHIFLFIVPLALTALFLVLLSRDELAAGNLRKPALWLAGLVVFLGLAVGAMGFIISAAARWG